MSFPLTTIAMITTVGDVRTVSNISQGDALTQRDGEKVSPFFLTLRFQWRGQALGVNDIYRTIIFYDKRQVVSTTPAITAVLQELHPLAQYNTQNRGRFGIIYDQTFTGVNDTLLRNSFVGIINRKLNFPMQFAGATSTAVVKNGIFMINISNQGLNPPDFIFTLKLMYNDS